MHVSGCKSEEKSLGLHHHPPVAETIQMKLEHWAQHVGKEKKNTAAREKKAETSAVLSLHLFPYFSYFMY